jgi:signal transduction histidine kinase
MIQRLLDLQENSIIVYKEGSIVYLNRAFLDLTKSKNLDDFLSCHKDIDELFVPKEGYFSSTKKDISWLNALCKEYQKDRKVLIVDVNTQKQKVFFVTLNKDSELTLVTLTEITKVEKQMRLLEDISIALEEAHQVELSHRFALEKEAIERERLMVQQSKMAELGEMIAVITHQWKQPLNILSIKIQEFGFRKEIGKLDDNFIDSFEPTLMKQIEFMSKTIDDFRNFFSPNRSSELFRVNDAINDVLALLGNVFVKNEIKVDFAPCEGVELYGHTNELKQVLLNIIGNAKDQIIGQIKKNHNFLGTIDITLLQSDDIITITVADNAGGIPPEVLPHIFEAYYTTKGQSGGSGIGLHIAKLIVERNFGGSIKAENIGEGALFTIKLHKEKHE